MYGSQYSSGTANAQNPTNEQPGLEPISYHFAPAVSDLPQVVDDDQASKIVVDSTALPNGGQKLEAETAVTPSPKPSRRRLYIIIGVIVAIVVIVAAVVGGVVGSRRSGSSGSGNGSGGDGSGSSTTTTPMPSPTTSINQIRRNSPLTVTGLRSDSGVRLWLMYQDKNGGMRYSLYDSSLSETTWNNSYWANSTGISSAIGSGMSLAAGMYLGSAIGEGQLEAFYLNSTSGLLGVNYSPTNGWLEDSINQQDYSTFPDTNLAAYWPYLFCQDRDGTGNLVEVTYGIQGSVAWRTRDIPVYPMIGSKLAVVPISTNPSKIVEIGGYGLVYQGTDGLLAVNIPDATAAGSNLTLSWPSSFPSIPLPGNASLAALSVARAGDSTGLVSTFILYQDASGRINEVRTTDSKTWQTSQPSAMAVADNGTNIACLTMPAWGIQALTLESASDFTRCYLQRDGRVIEFKLDGTDWVELTTLPLF